MSDRFLIAEVAAVLRLTLVVAPQLVAATACSTGGQGNPADDRSTCSLSECVAACVAAGGSGGSCHDGSCRCIEIGAQPRKTTGAHEEPSASNALPLAAAPAVCGDSRVDPGEECDDGARNSDSTPDGCRANCRRARCGDAVVDRAERCDDGNTISADGCESDCSFTCVSASNCDDGHACNGEETCGPDHVCLPGSPVPTNTACTLPDGTSGACRGGLCAPTACGNGVTEPGEGCDDGNTDNTDACLTNCSPASCGDGLVWTAHEDCDSATPRSCTSACGSTGTQPCTNCRWDPACAPPAEVCNGRDDDCDAAVDEDFTCVPGAAQPCSTPCASTGAAVCSATCAWSACALPLETCNGADDDCDGETDEDVSCMGEIVAKLETLQQAQPPTPEHPVLRCGSEPPPIPALAPEMSISASQADVDCRWEGMPIQVFQRSTGAHSLFYVPPLLPAMPVWPGRGGPTTVGIDLQVTIPDFATHCRTPDDRLQALLAFARPLPVEYLQVQVLDPVGSTPCALVMPGRSHQYMSRETPWLEFSSSQEAARFWSDVRRDPTRLRVRVQYAREADFARPRCSIEARGDEGAAIREMLDRHRVGVAPSVLDDPSDVVVTDARYHEIVSSLESDLRMEITSHGGAECPADLVSNIITTALSEWGTRVPDAQATAILDEATAPTGDEQAWNKCRRWRKEHIGLEVSVPIDPVSAGLSVGADAGAEGTPCAGVLELHRLSAADLEVRFLRELVIRSYSARSELADQNVVGGSGLLRCSRDCGGCCTRNGDCVAREHWSVLACGRQQDGSCGRCGPWQSCSAGYCASGRIEEFAFEGRLLSFRTSRDCGGFAFWDLDDCDLSLTVRNEDGQQPDHAESFNGQDNTDLVTVNRALFTAAGHEADQRWTVDVKDRDDVSDDPLGQCTLPFDAVLLQRALDTAPGAAQQSVECQGVGTAVIEVRAEQAAVGFGSSWGGASTHARQ